MKTQQNVPSPSIIDLDLIIAYVISNMLRYSLYIAITEARKIGVESIFTPVKSVSVLVILIILREVINTVIL